jgi:chromosome segregation ATPase
MRIKKEKLDEEIKNLKYEANENGIKNNELTQTILELNQKLKEYESIIRNKDQSEAEIQTQIGALKDEAKQNEIKKDQLTKTVLQLNQKLKEYESIIKNNDQSEAEILIEIKNLKYEANENEIKNDELTQAILELNHKLQEYESIIKNKDQSEAGIQTEIGNLKDEAKQNEIKKDQLTKTIIQLNHKLQEYKSIIRNNDQLVAEIKKSIEINKKEFDDKFEKMQKENWKSLDEKEMIIKVLQSKLTDFEMRKDVPSTMKRATTINGIPTSNESKIVDYKSVEDKWIEIQNDVRERKFFKNIIFYPNLFEVIFFCEGGGRSDKKNKKSFSDFL